MLIKYMNTLTFKIMSNFSYIGCAIYIFTTPDENTLYIPAYIRML